MRALVVEPDPVWAQRIDAALKSEGFVSEPAEVGEDAIDLLTHHEFDVVLLEFRLPDMSAPEVVRRLRAACIRTPVLILSEISDAADKVRCLTAGADDYLTKPYHTGELIARIHAVVRRSKGHSESVIRTGKLVVNLDTRSVSVDGQQLHVTGKEYSILELLSLRKGATLSREMILDHLYGGIDEPEVKIIDVFMAKLRKKIAAATRGQHYIETVWGRGYVLKDPEINVPMSPSVLEEDLQKEIIGVLDALNSQKVKSKKSSQTKIFGVKPGRIFLAHAQEDKQRVRDLYTQLKGSGFNPWLDEIDILPGENWKFKIQNAIRDADVFLACLSSHSVDKKGYVQTEFRTALSAYSERPSDAIYIIPVKLDECEVPDMQIPDRGITLRDIHYVELWEQNGVLQLTKAIRHALANHPQAE